MTKICPYLNAECIKGACVMWVKPRLDQDGVTVLEAGYCVLAKS